MIIELTEEQLVTILDALELAKDEYNKIAEMADNIDASGGKWRHFALDADFLNVRLSSKVHGV